MARRLPGMRDCRGQASIEYLGLVGLLVLVMGALAVPALAGQDVAGALVAQMRRALCVVSRGDCEAGRRPCPVATDETTESQHVNLAIVRYGQDRLSVREDRSDGSVAVTVLKDHRFGLEAGLGADAHAFGYGFGASLRGALLARLGSGTTIVFRNARAADTGMALLAQGRRPAGAKALRLMRGGAGAELALLGGRGSLRASDDLIVGRALDESDGSTTYALRGAWRADGALGLVRAGVAGSARADMALTLTRARDGRFLDLGVEATGQLSGTATLPRTVAAVAGLLGHPDVAGEVIPPARRWTLEQHLDLTEPGNRAVAASFVRALAHPRELPGAGSALARRLASGGVTDVRTYSVASESEGVGAHIGVGGKLGGADDWREERTRLLAALQRGPDGIWRRRIDCVGAV